MRTRIPSGRSSDKHCTGGGAANIPFNGSSWKATSVAPATLFRPALGNPTPNSCAFSRSLEKLKPNSRDTRFTLNPPIWAAAICQSSSGIGSRPCFCLRHSANRALSFSKFLVAILVPPCGNHSNRMLEESRTLAERTRYSGVRWSETGRLGKRRTSSAVGCFQTRCEETKTASPRPIVLDRAEDDLDGLEIGAGDRSTRNGDFMAAESIQTVLVETLATENT